jgi:hypothetical protein
VPGAKDAARSNVLAVIENAAIANGEAAVVASAHEAHLAMDASLLPLEAHGLMRVEATAANAVPDASLLVELALADGLPLGGRRGCLGDGDGGRHCKGRR